MMTTVGVFETLFREKCLQPFLRWEVMLLKAVSKDLSSIVRRFPSYVDFFLGHRSVHTPFQIDSLYHVGAFFRNHAQDPLVRCDISLKCVLSPNPFASGTYRSLTDSTTWCNLQGVTNPGRYFQSYVRIDGGAWSFTRVRLFARLLIAASPFHRREFPSRRRRFYGTDSIFGHGSLHEVSVPPRSDYSFEVLVDHCLHRTVFQELTSGEFKALKGSFPWLRGPRDCGIEISPLMLPCPAHVTPASAKTGLAMEAEGHAVRYVNVSSSAIGPFMHVKRHDPDLYSVLVKAVRIADSCTRSTHYRTFDFP